MSNPVVEWLKTLVERQASDLFLTAGFPPALKLDGRVVPLSETKLSGAETQALAKSVMNDKQWNAFLNSREANFAIYDEAVGRFRVSAFMQQGRVGIVFRTINTQIPELDSLHLPPILRDLSMMPRGLVLLVGATGSGKSTSLAAMIGYRNQRRADHILTVEDPIEFVHQHGQSIITQREVGSDTEDWHTALKNSLRQAPDVILIGEIRERSIMEFALSYAETGHLCLSTLHANNASQALERILSFFPLERRDQLLLELSMNLRGIVSQRLVPRADGTGRIPATEVMLNSPLMSELIQKNRLDEVRGLMARSRELGMQTFDQSLFDLYQAQAISGEEALRNADSFNDLRLKIKLGGRDQDDHSLKTPDRMGMV
ncbi:MAG: PilT/PilU family type 4a pilus ATPase [Pseudomonadota bacterium]